MMVSSFELNRDLMSVGRKKSTQRGDDRKSGLPRTSRNRGLLELTLVKHRAQDIKGGALREELANVDCGLAL